MIEPDRTKVVYEKAADRWVVKRRNEPLFYAPTEEACWKWLEEEEDTLALMHQFLYPKEARNEASP